MLRLEQVKRHIQVCVQKHMQYHIIFTTISFIYKYLAY